jgi:hypothetical protein
LWELRSNPQFRNYRSDPRFVAVVKQMGFEE